MVAELEWIVLLIPVLVAYRKQQQQHERNYCVTCLSILSVPRF